MKFPPKRAARGKIILTLVVHTIFYHLPKFHEISFNLTKWQYYLAYLPLFPPKPPLSDPFIPQINVDLA